MKVIRHPTASDGFILFDDGSGLYLPASDYPEHEVTHTDMRRIAEEFEAWKTRKLRNKCHPADVTFVT